MYGGRFIRENRALLRERLALRGVDGALVDAAHEAAELVAGLAAEEMELNGERNRLIGEDARANAGRIREIKARLAALRGELSAAEAELAARSDALPNLPDESLTGSAVEVRRWGSPRDGTGLVPHRELCRRLDLLSLEDGAALSGSGFAVYRDRGARLYRALIEFTLRSNMGRGYRERWLPVLLQRHSLYGTAQLPKFEDDLFRTADGMYLSPTSESQLVNLYRDRIVAGSELPIRLTANTNCFRREAGAAGMEDAGIIRLHQFAKTELVAICRPEESPAMLHAMVEDACSILESLNLPHRVLQLAYDDMGFASSKTYDIEVWFPSEGRYREISSVSNTLDFQARRARIRYKDNVMDRNERAKHPHILNGSSLAIDRLFAAVVDNFQRPDGGLDIPEGLADFLGFSEILD